MMAFTDSVITSPDCRRSTGNPSKLLLLHGSAGSSVMWRDYLKHLTPSHEVLTPDLIGYGSNLNTPDPSEFSLDHEVDQLLPLLPKDQSLHVAGYSYGGVVALRLALRKPSLIASLTLIEPVAFPLLGTADEDARREVMELRNACELLVQSGRLEDALGRFFDYWSGPGAFDMFPENRRRDILRTGSKILLDFEASFGAVLPRELLQTLEAPTLIVSGSLSPGATRAIAVRLAGLLPNAQALTVSTANHSLPFTHTQVLCNALRERLGGASCQVT